MTRRLSPCLAPLLFIVLAKPAAAQQQPAFATAAIDIPRGEIEAVLAYTGSEGAGTDRQIRVIPLSSSQLGIGVLRRLPTTAGAPVNAIAHTDVTEVLYFISGSGTIVTGGPVQNPIAYPPDTEFVRLAVGPSTGGSFLGGERRVISAGDVVVIPAGVAHGFDDVTSPLTYLSVRIDEKRVLPAGYLHPALRK